MGGFVGKQGAEAIQEMIANARKPKGIIAAVIGVATLLFGPRASLASFTMR